MPDFLDASSYAGGLAAALNDGVIVELTDLVEEHCPLYYYYGFVNAEEDTTKSLADDEGRILSLYEIKMPT